MLDGRATWADVAAIIGPEDAYRSDHQVILGAASEIDAAGGTPDRVTVLDFLEHRDQIPSVGGREYIDHLVKTSPGASNIVSYAQIIRKHAKRRQLIEIGRRLADDAEDDDDLDLLIETHVRALADLGDRSISKATGDNPLDWLKSCELTDDEAEQISDPTWWVPGLFADGHVIAVVAKPNGGKTTIVFHLACEWAAHRTVVYIDVDTNAADAKRKLRLARQHGVRYLTPDLKAGKSILDVMAELQRLADSDADLSGHVWIFDTLKRMANVINKDSLKGVLGLMRKLSARGMTCILLAHTNKYRNQDGEYQYEGTGDLEADVDELIYFEPRENPDRSVTVSTRCTKRRAAIADLTWDIAPDRTVTQREQYVDVAAEARDRKQEDDDTTAIEAIRECLSDGPRKQTDVVKHCRAYSLTDKTVRRVLKRYRGRHWLEAQLPKDNAKEYRVIPRMTAHPSKPAEPENRIPF